MEWWETMRPERGKEWLWRGALIAAAAIVGVAIVADGTSSRIANGVGGTLWLVATGGLIWSARQAVRILTVVALVTVATLLALVVRPTNLALALVGFGAGGALVASLAPSVPITWSAMLSGLWLPAHIVTSIGRSLLAGDEARVRTEPPPTAALVPLAIVVGAIVAGAAVDWWKRSNSPPARQRANSATT